MPAYPAKYNIPATIAANPPHRMRVEDTVSFLLI